MTEPTFGLRFIRQNDQPLPVIGANLDVIGIIGPCDTADEDKFPLNTPVLRYSNDTDLGDDIGTDGYWMDAINGINDQMADYQVAEQVVFVRTEYGTAADANEKLQQTIANIMGNSTLGSGLHAFKNAPNMIYCTPRLIIAPGYTGQMANSLDTLETANDGVGYTPGQEYSVTFVEGAGEQNSATLILPTAHAVADSDGNIRDDEIVIDSYGAWMSAAPTATLPAPDGPEITALAASGSITFTRQPGVGSTIVLNGKSVSFVSGTPTGLQVQLGADLGATLAALLTFLNGSADTDIDDNTYSLSGGILNIVNDAPGVGGNAYTLATTVTGAQLSGSHLTGGRDAASPVQATLTATIALGANPIVAAATGVLDTLMAHMIAESPGSSELGDKNWRNTINSKRIIPLSGGVKVMDSTSGDIVVRPFAPRVVGAIVARDYATGAPFHSAGNTAIQGIVGPARTIAFSLVDGATEGQQLLADNIGILARGLIGVETAISNGGFVYIGTDNCSDDPLWKFFNITRGRDYIELSLMPTLRTYLGRSNIDRQTVVNIITTMRSFLSRLKAQQHIIGFTCDFQGAMNSAEEIRLGHLTVSFAAEEPPPLVKITTMSARYRPAIDVMVMELERQLNMSAAA
jgi:phage tail sheath protein FI